MYICIKIKNYKMKKNIDICQSFLLFSISINFKIKNISCNEDNENDELRTWTQLISDINHWNGTIFNLNIQFFSVV